MKAFSLARSGEGGRRDRARAPITLSRALLLVLVVLLLILPAGCRQAEGLDERLNPIVTPYRFSLVRWELAHILERSHPPQGSGSNSRAYDQTVLEYFALAQRINTLQWEINAVASGGREGDMPAQQEELAKLQSQQEALRPAVVWILGQQVRAAFNKEGIYNPADRLFRLSVPFPPLNFRLAQPPSILIISRRERIESIRGIMLVPQVDLEASESIEEQTDALGVSSLVEGLGGFGGTYPSFVADVDSLHWTIATIAEEWLHQYLAFTPLGFTYLLNSLGIRLDYEVATMNETVASIVTDEVADLVYRTHYAPSEPVTQAPATPPSEPATPPPFDFNSEMRKIRLAVDDMLAKGQVDEAEQFMEERRQYLATQGYYIRKLNQAYFAFYGTYANEPTSVSPIGVELRELRSRSSSVRDFLNRVAGMTSRSELQVSVQ